MCPCQQTRKNALREGYSVEQDGVGHNKADPLVTKSITPHTNCCQETKEELHCKLATRQVTCHQVNKNQEYAKSKPKNAERAMTTPHALLTQRSNPRVNATHPSPTCSRTSRCQ